MDIKERIIYLTNLLHRYNYEYYVLDNPTVEDVEYALLLPASDAKDDEEGEILVMRVRKEGEEYSFEVIEDDDEFNRIAEYIEELEDEIED